MNISGDPSEVTHDRIFSASVGGHTLSYELVASTRIGRYFFTGDDQNWSFDASPFVGGESFGTSQHSEGRRCLRLKIPNQLLRSNLLRDIRSDHPPYTR